MEHELVFLDDSPQASGAISCAYTDTSLLIELQPACYTNDSVLMSDKRLNIC